MLSCRVLTDNTCGPFCVCMSVYVYVYMCVWEGGALGEGEWVRETETDRQTDRFKAAETKRNRGKVY